MACQLPSSHAADLRTGAYRDPRVSYFLQPGDRLVQCAYDKDHWILATKITNHLVKCRHNYLNNVNKGIIKVTEATKMAICPYNSAHHLPKGELPDHEENVCESNPFRTDFFKKMDAEKIRRDAIAAEEKRLAELKATPANPWTKCDPGEGAYGDAQNSSAGFWGTDQKPGFKFQERGRVRNMEMGGQEADQKPWIDAGGAVGGGHSENIKEESMEDLDVKGNIGDDNMNVKEEAGACGGFLPNPRFGMSAATAALLKMKKEEEAAERDREIEEGKLVRPGQFGGITTPCTAYKDKKKRAEEIDERGLTKEDRKDPNKNWELVPPTIGVATDKRFMSYDPRKTMKINEEQGKMYIQNPQGLTKSEKKEWRARQAEILLIERPDEERQGSSLGGASSGFNSEDDAARAARMRRRWEMEREMDLDDQEPPPIIAKQVRTRRGQAKPTCPGFELQLDMQQNPAEEYKKWESSSCCSSSFNSNIN